MKKLSNDKTPLQIQQDYCEQLFKEHSPPELSVVSLEKVGSSNRLNASGYQTTNPAINKLLSHARNLAW